jgi:hypothetical protein
VGGTHVSRACEANGILGVWMFASPSILAFATRGGAAARTAWFLGAVIVVFAGLAAYLPKAWEEVINILLGIYVSEIDVAEEEGMKGGESSLLQPILMAWNICGVE